MASEGIDLNPAVGIPSDPYTETRKPVEHIFNTPSNWDSLKKFLELDRKVLQFYAVWDDRDSAFGEMRPFVSNACSNVVTISHDDILWWY